MTLRLQPVLEVFLLWFIRSHTVTGDVCPTGDYVLVRHNDHINDRDRQIRPNCQNLPLGILTEHLLHSPEQCFNLACKVNANVIYYDPKIECAAYQCEADPNRLDWTYNWTSESASYSGKTFARPHESVQSCHNSYFMQRTWNSNVQATCFIISNDTAVDNLGKCAERSCEDKANAFNFIVQSKTMFCETLHCKWNVTVNDYSFNLRPNINGNSEVHSLSHTIKPCMNLLQTDSVNFSVLIPNDQQCGFPGHFKRNLSHSTDKEISNFFCESGSNTFIHVSHKDLDDKYLAYKCSSNHEGTSWDFFADNARYGDNVTSEWWIAPYPGTPNCQSDIFKLMRMKASHQMSNCDPRGSMKVLSARDLRQCMLYACEKGYNVINFFSNDDFVDCELRNCGKYKGGDYAFQYSATGGTYGYDVYALHPDYSIRNITDNPTTIAPALAMNQTCNALCIVFAVLFFGITIISIIVAGLYLWKRKAEKNNNNKQGESYEMVPQN
ncbi:unnamed protein product [Owenia fusiformis]|uniref:Uncharacterized protein n=1 Tax=Owenia fusiformis TaxID=6347 RepID=A0A8S4PRQ9_OWEFU|nr:unnamed protein product [Owenia fusiformis]